MNNMNNCIFESHSNRKIEFFCNFEENSVANDFDEEFFISSLHVYDLSWKCESQDTMDVYFFDQSKYLG